LQERHSPPQAVLQQTPSAQCPDAHSTSPMGHNAPFIFLPQLPLSHRRPVTQSASLMHAEKHRLVAASQENGAQTVDGASLQDPAPSHVLMWMTASPLHMPFMQTVPAS
jgi:hypothetical protein